LGVVEMPTMGLYGKLPCNGDFLQRRLPQEFVDVWDAWVRESMAASRSQLAERWLDIYLTAPVWRFVLAPGLCGNHTYAGVFLPSVDRVGRYFPLTVVARWKAAEVALSSVSSQERWFDAAESLALQALESITLEAEEFDRSVIGLGAQIEAGLEGRTVSPGRSELAELSELERTLYPLTLWWTEGSYEVGSDLLCITGLPKAASFASMLSGTISDAVRIQLPSASCS
jgi:type VI secretion system protein ImpM